MRSSATVAIRARVMSLLFQADMATKWNANEQDFCSKIRDGILAEEAERQGAGASSSAGPPRGALNLKRNRSGLGDDNSAKKLKTEGEFSQTEDEFPWQKEEGAETGNERDGTGGGDGEDGDGPPSERSVDMEDL